MIIFGSRSTKKIVDTGDFACPRCGADRAYGRLRTRRFFHVFFIPLVPIGHPTEVVQSATCRSYFRSEVLANPTSSKLLAALDQVVQLVVMTAICASESYRPARADAARWTLQQRGWPPDHIASTVDWALQADVELAGEMHAQLCSQMAQVAPTVQLAGLEPIVMAYGSILGADGTFDDARASLVADLGRAAGLTAAHVQGIVAGVEAAIRRS